MPLYDRIGARYAEFRRADARMTQAIVGALQLSVGSTVADVGAGTGKYARALADRGLQVVAIEPSRTMLDQATPHAGVRYLQGAAERLPLATGSVDAVTCVLSVNHFTDLDACVDELDRVSDRGTLVMVTVDPRQAAGYWLNDYLPSIHATNLSRVAPIEQLAATLKRQCSRRVTVSSLDVPSDFADLFFGAGFSRPRLLLDKAYQSQCSSYARTQAADLQLELAALEADLDNGAFERKYEHQLRQAFFDVGLRILHVESARSGP